MNGMALRVHHLNCGTMCPISARLVSGEGSYFERGRLVCHCVLIETNDGLILVDTGLGTADVAHPKARLGSSFAAISGAKLDHDETALAQIERLGFHAADVRHIVPTHMDLDHIGGLSDFPKATVHVFHREHTAAMDPRTLGEKSRYRAVQWSHRPAWNVHPSPRPNEERWFGFEAVRAIGAGSAGDVLLVPLHGHTRGHCAVAVRTNGKVSNGSNGANASANDASWLLHAGDAYFHHAEMDEPPSCPRGLDLFQRAVAVDDALRRENQARLRELARGAGAKGRDVRVFSAHCPTEFARFG
jgi:glyoxylase-like metal-dependent hydrolase (beta-lactamase superfamily II)